VGIEQDDSGVRLDIETPSGHYTLAADYVIAADGARSPLRDLMGLEWKGQIFRDRFLIADVHMKGEFRPSAGSGSILRFIRASRCCCIDRPTTSGASTSSLAGRRSRRGEKPERVSSRIRAMLGDERPFELEWVSVYTFQCRRLDRFVHGCG